jgi:hypothetical protein
MQCLVISVIKLLCRPHLPDMITAPVKRLITNLLYQNSNRQTVHHI